ncbi:MAG: helix-turn-helix domain-containing protein [Methylobacteriaceae bacterium]|nr:helix-turn-helix domain-containing protein [Methylobacteriaceae bacterium]
MGDTVALATIAPAGDPTEGARLRRLTTLLEVARMLTAELDLSEIVRQVLVRAIAVIPAADAGTLYLEDSASGRLIVTDTVGFGPSMFKLSLKPGEAAAGHAFVTGRGEIYPTRETVQAILADATPETLRYFHEASEGPRSPNAALTAPLVFKGKVLGVLVVDALRNGKTFTAEDLAMLEDFAQIAAIAIVNAGLYEAEHLNRIRLEVLNDEITRQRDELGQRLAALDSMAQIGRQELGLAALAVRLADLTSARAYIFDGLGRVRAAEPSIAQTDHLAERLASEHIADLLRRVAMDHRPRTAMADGAHFAASPIVSGADLLGCVLVEAVDPASPNVNVALAEMAALIASTVFVRERALEEGVVRGRADLLERLLDGKVPKSAGSFQALPLPLQLAVGRLRRNDAAHVAAPLDGNMLREVSAIAQESLTTQSVPTVVLVRGECVVLAWSAGRGEVRFNPREKLETVAATVMKTARLRIRFALTEPISDPLLVPQMFQEARLAVEMRPWTDSPVVDASSFGAYRLIIGATSARHAVEFSQRTLADAIAHDAKHKSCLVGTLRTYLAKGSSLSLAARELGVHVHTIRYRLTKLEELTGLKLQNAEDRLTLELALRILDIGVPSRRELHLPGPQPVHGK